MFLNTTRTCRVYNSSMALLPRGKNKFGYRDRATGFQVDLIQLERAYFDCCRFIIGLGIYVETVEISS